MRSTQYTVTVRQRGDDLPVEVFTMFVKPDDDVDYKANKLMTLYWPSQYYYCEHERVGCVRVRDTDYETMENV